MLDPGRGGKGADMDDRSNEPTATDERVAENETPAPVAPVTRKPDAEIDPATGLPRGMHDDDASPLDRGKPLDPFGGASPAERAKGVRPEERRGDS
ncbi:MAG: hypothetical protein QOI11_985 [Candidatus Eremiobacteraeota bacterium]|nr:hypothetical protein [Candidatus Eremiobacteraeota bacterium]